ncbi:MAG TPA: OmpA family protein [Candidatus Kapabacteria bacterium]|nr:OmpA family protein [Candidatus Kapabacteria bacterium]
MSTALLFLFSVGYAQPPTDGTPQQAGAASTVVRTRDTTNHVIIRNIDIGHYPVLSIAFDLLDTANVAVDGLRPEDLVILENDSAVQLLSLTKVTSENRIPIDFVFVLDVTGSMRGKMIGIKESIGAFCERLATSGISYRVGLITFGDTIVARHEPTEDLATFASWIRGVQAAGGGDMKENALEGLAAATLLHFRPSANRCAIIISDMPYHQDGESGDGTTQYTTETIAQAMNLNQMETFCVAPDDVPGYKSIASATGGTWFDMTNSFSSILNSFTTLMTPHYIATFRSAYYMMPDSLTVEVRMSVGQPAQRRRIAVAEVGRRLLLKDILFATNSYQIDLQVHPELDYIAQLLQARPQMTLRIEGHTDNVGAEPLNRALSEHRAESVRDYLVHKGIDAARLPTFGFGMSRPVASNATEEGRQLNRRIEFLILSK